MTDADSAGPGPIETDPLHASLEPEILSRLGALSLELKVQLLTGADFWALHPQPAVRLRRVVTSDGPAGVRGELWDERDTAANVPSPTALAATWNEDSVFGLGLLLAEEARAKGVDVLLAPTVNLHRSPYGGRHFECFSEDPVLSARIGAAYVRGVQSGGVAATVKHFVANDSETDRFNVDVRLDERTLREVYLAPFEAIVREARVWAVMAAYNSVNGTTMTQSPLLWDVLKQEWGFDGVVMSDWFATRTTAPAGAGGLDLAMPGPNGPWGPALIAAVLAGQVPEAAVDDKVVRILRLAARVGALEGIAPAVASPVPRPAAEVATTLRSIAAAGMVLTQNSAVDGAAVLPLRVDELSRVAVLGPNAAGTRTLGGGSATVFAPYTISFLQGLRAALSEHVRVDHVGGVRATDRLPAAPLEMLFVPESDEPGLLVRFLSPDGVVLGTEARRAAAFTWNNMVLPDVRVRDVGQVEVHTRLRATREGRHLIGVSAVGPAQLLLDGRVMLDEVISLPSGADPVEGMMRPPQRSVALTLRDGEEVDVQLRYVTETSSGFGEADVASITLQLNVAVHEDEDEELSAAVALARASDVAIVVVGTSEEVESEGFDRDTLALPGRQDELVRAVLAANPRTVVVVNSGAPVLLPWADDVPAVLAAWFPGQEAGHALADVLTGAVEPGGRLPTTWPVDETAPLPAVSPHDGRLPYDEGLHIGHRGYERAGVEPRYWLGHGLGYTTWQYLSADVALTESGGARLLVRVRNTGGRAGRDVVQAYLSRPGSSVDRPARWLAGFGAVTAAPGEEAVASIDVPERSFAHWSERGWTVEPGVFRLSVGRSAADTVLTVRVHRP